jgi:hypothetical protein
VSDELVRLFGTSEPPATAEPVTVGALSCRLTAGGLADIRWHGVELIRAVDYPIRDADWGTKPTRTLALHRRETADGLVIDRRFETEDASVGGSARAELFADGRLHVHLRLDIRTDVDLCRAGFTLLHPIAGFAGAPLLIRHPDGDESRTVFPLRIMPAQPATDIAGMRYGGDGVSVDIELSGALFEMEDQRNWSDASYKTYGKTASFPFPYRLERGAVIEQTLTLRCEGMPAAPAARRLAEAIAFADARESLPELALAGDGAADLTAALPEPIDRLRRVVRLDLRQALEEPLPRPAGPVDVELVVTDERSGPRLSSPALPQPSRRAATHPSTSSRCPPLTFRAISRTATGLWALPPPMRSRRRGGPSPRLGSEAACSPISPSSTAARPTRRRSTI